MVRSAKGPGSATRKGRSSGRVAAKGQSLPGRYTPPVPREVKRSPVWFAPLIGVLLVVGMLTILLNYFEVLPSSPSNWYLLGGIVLIAGGFLFATRWR